MWSNPNLMVIVEKVHQYHRYEERGLASVTEVCLAYVFVYYQLSTLCFVSYDNCTPIDNNKLRTKMIMLANCVCVFVQKFTVCSIFIYSIIHCTLPLFVLQVYVVIYNDYYYHYVYHYLLFLLYITAICYYSYLSNILCVHTITVIWSLFPCVLIYYVYSIAVICWWCRILWL